MYTFILKKDGNTLVESHDSLDLYRYIHDNHSYSMSHAVQYEGYTVEEIEHKNEIKKDITKTFILK